jgi:hypothetical protein
MKTTPSLRRHYPDQVFGYNLRSSRQWRNKHPGNTEVFFHKGAKVTKDIQDWAGNLCDLSVLWEIFKNCRKIKGKKFSNCCNFSTLNFVPQQNHSFMKKIFLSLLLVAAFYNLLAQKPISDANAEKRTVGSFHGINVGTGIKLIMSEGNTEEVAVSADKIEYRDKIVTKVENGILKIYYENKFGAINSKKEKKELKAYVSYKNIDELDANTGADVKVEGTLRASSLKMNTNTGATVTATVKIDNLDVDQNTGAEIMITGETTKLTVHGDTGAMFKGTGLKTDNCSVTASTGAGIYITVQKELNVKANTGGFVKYKGDVAVKEIKTNTGGSVSRI